MTSCENCTYKPYCIARLNDRTIVGCDMEDYQAGRITKSQFQVMHRIKQEGEG